MNFEKGKLKGVSSGRTMQSIRSDVQEKEVVINGMSRKMEQKRDQLMESQRKLSDLEREVNKLNSQKVNWVKLMCLRYLCDVLNKYYE